MVWTNRAEVMRILNSDEIVGREIVPRLKLSRKADALRAACASSFMFEVWRKHLATPVKEITSTPFEPNSSPTA
jgi:hypothetical protein